MSDQDRTKRCPHCAEAIMEEAIVCRFCGRDLPSGALTTPSGREQGQVEPVVRARSDVASGVKLGCGMFIVLPLLLLFGFIFLVMFLGTCGAMLEGSSRP